MSAQGLRGIKQFPLLTVLPKINAAQTEADLLHPDGFVANTQVTLHDALAPFPPRVTFLGKRIADMDLGGSHFPLNVKHMRGANTIRVAHVDNELSAYHVDLHDRAMPRYFSVNAGFAVVDIAELPPIGASHFVSAIVEDDAAILVPLDEVAVVKVMMTFKPEVRMDPFTAAIIPPGSPILMQGARSILIRPTLP